MKTVTRLHTVTPIALETLAERIGVLHREIEATPGRYEEMFALLTQARKGVGHGEWLKWLAEHEAVLGFGERQAQRYLREPDTYVSGQEIRRDKDKTAYRVRKSIAERATPKAKQMAAYWADKRTELTRYKKMFAAEEIERRKTERAEAKAIRDHAKVMREAELRFVEERFPFYTGITKERAALARALVAAGFRALSLKAHPDTGGTTDAQSELTNTRNWLLRLIEYPQHEATMDFELRMRKPT